MTGTPYMLYKDHCNRKSNQQNLGSWDQFGGQGPQFPVIPCAKISPWANGLLVAHNVKYPLRKLGFVLKLFILGAPLEVFS